MLFYVCQLYKYLCIIKFFDIDFPAHLICGNLSFVSSCLRGSHNRLSRVDDRTHTWYKRPINTLRSALIGLSFVVAVWLPLRAQQAVPPGAAPTLDFEVFKTKVLPIFTSARKGNARCVACHSRGGGNSFLEPLPPGASVYNDDQARRIFARVERLVVPGEPLKSILLLNPLAEEAGGSHWHGGGKHWASQDNPEFQVLVEWVRGSAK